MTVSGSLVGGARGFECLVLVDEIGYMMLQLSQFLQYCNRG